MARVALDNLEQLVEEVLASLVTKKVGATIIALQGNLGAGKTTFVQALARNMGVEASVQSPTYVLMKSYPVSYRNFTMLIHIDAYRLEKPEEFAALNPETFLKNAENLVCIEWPERVEGALPTPDLVLTFSVEGVGEKERNITYA